eukprot:Trichotokara_eunicae@DN6227_c0_g3_i2.p1
MLESGRPRSCQILSRCFLQDTRYLRFIVGRDKSPPSYKTKLVATGDIAEVVTHLVQPSSAVSVALTVKLLDIFFPKSFQRLMASEPPSSYCQSTEFEKA